MAIRAKSTLELEGILEDLKIKPRRKLGKSELQELTFVENAVERWEQLYAEQKKPERSPNLDERKLEERGIILARLAGLGMSLSLPIDVPDAYPLNDIIAAGIIDKIDILNKNRVLGSLSIEELHKVEKIVGGMRPKDTAAARFAAAVQEEELPVHEDL